MQKYNQTKIIIPCKTIPNIDEECTFHLNLNKKYDFFPKKNTKKTLLFYDYREVIVLDSKTICPSNIVACIISFFNIKNKLILEIVCPLVCDQSLGASFDHSNPSMPSLIS